MPFIADVQQERKPRFIPDVENKPSVPDVSVNPRFVPDSSDTQQEPFRIAGIPIPTVKGLKEAFIKTYNIADIPHQKAAKIAKKLAEIIPSQLIESESTALNVAGGVPRLGADVAAKFFPDFLAPEAVALGFAGRGARLIRHTPEFAETVQSVSKYIPTAIKKVLTYRFGQPEVYKEMAEKAIQEKALGMETATKIGKELSDKLSSAEKLRLGQIIKGSISQSDAESILRDKGHMSRAVLDSLEVEAKDLNLIPENALYKYSNKELAELRNLKASIDSKVARLKTVGGFPQKGELIEKAQAIGIIGQGGIRKNINLSQDLISKTKSLLNESKDYLTGEEFKGIEDILQTPMIQNRQRKTLENVIVRFEKLSIGKQEEVFNRLAKIAERAGIQVEKITPGNLKVSNVKGLITQINDISGDFPGRTALINKLAEKSALIQKNIVDSYRFSGQKYVPRLYAEKELETSIPAWGTKTNLIRKNRFLKRGDISEEMRKGMGEILEPGYPVAKGIVQVSQAVANAKLFRNIARNAEWTTSNAEEAAGKGFVQMAESKSLGELSGKFTHPAIADDINEITRIKGTWEKLYGNLLSKWKFGKVVANPSTHFRNMFVNTMFLDFGGVPHLQQLRLLPKAINELRNKGHYYKEIKEAGFLGQEFVGGEIMAMKDVLVNGKGPLLDKLAGYSERIANGIYKAYGATKTAADKLGQIYQSEEQVFKLAKFIKNREMGMGIKEAGADAEKWLFNYSKVSPAIKFLRQSPVGSPFITFTAKALPRLAETAMLNPIKLYKYKLLANAIETTARTRGITDEEIKTIKNTSRGQTLVLPFRDSNDDPLLLDLSYIMPWGDIGEAGGLFGLPPVSPPSGPLKVIAEIGLNKSAYTDKPIWNNKLDNPHEKFYKATDYALKAFLPSLTPGMPTDESAFKGGYSFHKIWSSIKGRPDYFGRVRPLFLTLLDTIGGLKISGFPVAENATIDVFKKKALTEELQYRFRGLVRNPNVSDEYKTKIADELPKRINRIWEEK